MLLLPLFVYALSLVAPVAARTAGQQFNLTPEKAGSACFLDCHKQAAGSFKLTGRNTNSPLAITKNCEESTWRERVSACLPVRCISAPDVAYATEYGVSFCRRAGVHVTFDLPEWFLESPGGRYYTSTLVPDSSAASRTSAAGVGAVVAAGIVGFVAYLP